MTDVSASANTSGVITCLALAGALTWFFIPIGPTWALVSVVLSRVLTVVLGATVEYAVSSAYRLKARQDMR